MADVSYSLILYQAAVLHYCREGLLIKMTKFCSIILPAALNNQASPITK